MSQGLKTEIVRLTRGGLWAITLLMATHSHGTETDATVSEPAPAEQSQAPQADDAAVESTNADAGDESGDEVPAPADQGTEASDTPGDNETTESGDVEETEPADLVAQTNRTSLLIGIAALLVVLIVLIRLVGRKRKQPMVAPEADNTDTAPPSPFGFFHITEAGQQRIYTLASETISVGRSDNNDLVLSDDTVSANHLVVKRERSGGVLVTDLNSSNGTRINGEEVAQATLVPGDALELGNVVIRFETRSPASPEDRTRQAG